MNQKPSPIARCVAALLATVAMNGLQAQRRTQIPPTLLHATAKAFVHALPAAPTASDALPRNSIVACGIGLTWTDRDTGTMRFLGSPTGTIALPTRRVSYSETRLAGVQIDDQRLYVATWFSPRRFQREPDATGSLRLQVFWLDDGSLLDTVSVARDAPRPEDESTASGVLEPAENGVKCGELTLVYEGKKRSR